MLSQRQNDSLFVVTNKEVEGVILIIDMKRLEIFPRFEDPNKAPLMIATAFTAIIKVMGVNQT